MQSLLYLSTATPLISTEDILDILKTARAFNKKNNITGLLLYHEGAFLQVIEGEKEVIHKLFYDKICLDNRHKNITKLLDYEIEERSFSDWSMGFKQISNNNWSELEGYLDIRNTKKFSQIASSGTPEVITLIKSYTDVNQLSL